jgi:hypothetical protein
MRGDYYNFLISPGLWIPGNTEDFIQKKCLQLGMQGHLGFVQKKRSHIIIIKRGKYSDPAIPATPELTV